MLERERKSLRCEFKNHLSGLPRDEKHNIKWVKVYALALKMNKKDIRSYFQKKPQTGQSQNASLPKETSAAQSNNLQVVVENSNVACVNEVSSTTNGK